MALDRGSVIQGFFPRGLPSSPRATVVFAPARPALQMKSTQPRSPVPASGPPSVTIQRFGSSQVMNVPANMPGLPCGGGQKMPASVQRRMESFFNTSFADVQIHVGPHAASIGALAFTLGSTIHFAPGQYNPASPQGQQLLGHELAHVVQQKSGRVRNPLGTALAIVHDPALEADADRLGTLAAGHTLQSSPSQVALRQTVAHPTAPAAFRPTIAAKKSCGCGCSKSASPCGGGGASHADSHHGHPAQPRPVQPKQIGARPVQRYPAASNVVMRAVVQPAGVIQRSCSKTREAEIERNVHYWCDQPRSCKNIWDCDDLKSRRSINQSCLAARNTMKSECYPDTDSNHQIQFDDIQKSIELCSSYISQTRGCA
jgi:hypothetical protein